MRRPVRSLSYPRGAAAAAVALAFLSLPAFAADAPGYELRIPVPGMRAEAPAAPTTPAPAITLQDVAGVVLSTLAFPDTAVGSNSAPRVAYLKNAGNAPLVFEGTPFVTAAPFSVAGHDCPAELAPTAICSVSVVFSPAAGQAYSGSLQVKSDAKSGGTLSLSGTGTMVGVAGIYTSATGNFTFVRKTSGEWVAVGRNAMGSLGLGHANAVESFVPVPALAGATRVVTAMYSTLAQFPDGTWKAAGNNSGGKMGLGHESPLLNFTPVPDLTGATEVQVNAAVTLARKPDGSWIGAGYGSALGINNTAAQMTFIALPDLAGASAVMASDQFVYAKRSDGTWVATGGNNYGQLGLGHTTAQSTFVPVPGISGATQVVASDRFVFARMADGSWRATGLNAAGQLGLGAGSAFNVTSFTPVPALTGATEVMTGYSHTLARFANGSWAGAGYGAALGIGNPADQPAFVAISALTGVSQVVIGGRHMFAKMSDGRWAATGNNWYGELGFGDTVDRYTFAALPLQL